MLGLILACFGSVFNVLTDASRKKILDCQHDAVLVGCWCKLVALGFCLLAVAGLGLAGYGLQLPPVGAALKLPAFAAFGLYLLLNTLLEGTAIWLNYRALQISPLSFCVPFLALTPVFLLPIGRWFLHEQISAGMIAGVFLVVTGSLVINRKLVAGGWLEPARAMVRDKGSRYMLLVAFLLATTAALDKWFVSSGGEAGLGVRVARVFTLSLGKSVMLAGFFAALGAWRLRKQSFAGGNPWLAVWRDRSRWVVGAGFFESVVLILQLLAIQFAVAAIVISIKRSGILLACGIGWWWFGERDITDRVIGSVVMVAGVAVFFLTKPDAHGAAVLGLAGALMVLVATLALLALALRLTRGRPGVGAFPGGTVKFSGLSGHKA